MLDQTPLAKPSLGWQTSLLGVINDYITLTKPPIVMLLLITAAGGMFLAAQSVPSWSVLGLVWLGGGLGAGGANALNHYLDQDIDQLMSRTRQRPVADRRISPHKALTFGILLNLLAFLVLVTWVNLLAAALTLAATLFYVFVYTSWLKRTTPQNIVIGGAAGGHTTVGGMGGGDRRPGPAGLVSVCHHLFLDAAPLLGVVLADPARLRAGRYPHAPGSVRPGLHHPEHLPLLTAGGYPFPDVRPHLCRRVDISGSGPCCWAAGSSAWPGGLSGEAPPGTPGRCISTPCFTWLCCLPP